MSSQIVTAIQQKGGTGKTTALCALASLMAEDGARIAIVDCDPQESASDFATSTEQSGLAIDYIQELDEDELVPKVKALKRRQQHDAIFIDTAGIASRVTDYAIHLADLVLVPVKPARPDVKGLLKSLRAVDRVNALKSGSIPTYILLSDVDSRTRITTTWHEQLKKLETPILSAQMLHRTGFREFMSSGGRLEGSARRVAREVLADMQVRKLITYYNLPIAAE